MPISHADRFIFIHVPKTAGTSVVNAMLAQRPDLEFMQRNAWPLLFSHPRGVELFRELRKHYGLNTVKEFACQHLPARVLRELVPADVWQTYFKFAFARNPWDLAVSNFHFLREMFKQHPTTQQTDPDIAFVVSVVDFANYIRALPYFAEKSDQYSQLSDAQGNLLVDFVGRFERLEQDFATICERVGLTLTLPHMNRGPRGSYRGYYTAETRDIVGRLYARDLEAFGYTF
jgi:hypothetical protein